jgi:hypothetical protein
MKIKVRRNVAKAVPMTIPASAPWLIPLLLVCEAAEVASGVDAVDETARSVVLGKMFEDCEEKATSAGVKVDVAEEVEV